jgi:hypothetical protein
MSRKIGLRTRAACAAAAAVVAMLVLPGRVQAAPQAMYADGHGGYYCDGTCSGSGCCQDRVKPT